jgi:cytochrome c-type biogenesis protein CcmF
MSIPFFIGLGGGTAKVVEEPLYHSVVVWFFAPIMLLMGAAPFLSWRAMRAVAFWGRLINVIGLTIGVLGIMMFALKMSDWSAHSHDLAAITFPFKVEVPRFSWVMCMFALTAFAAIANIWRLIELFPRSKMGVGGFMAHLGVATAMSGLILSRGLEMKTQLLVAENSPDSGLGYTVTYGRLTSDPQTDRDNKVEFEIRSDSSQSKPITARPGFFFVPGQGGVPDSFTWPSIEHTLTHDLYMSLGAPILTFWKEPETFKVGETRDYSEGDSQLKVTYLGLSREGEPGKAGTSFTAKLKIIENGREYLVEPKIVVGQQAVPVTATPSFYAAFIGMDAADKSAVIELYYRHPIYPIELFYKPMTLLVWVGTGIMTLGGLLSAFYRRNRRRPPSAEEARVESVEIEDNAALPVS